jgi:glutamate-ammonia-ligase adenylyltransferase
MLTVARPRSNVESSLGETAAMKQARRDIIRSLTGDIVEIKKQADMDKVVSPYPPADLPDRLAQIGFEESTGAADSFFAVALRLCTDTFSEERFADLTLACLDSPSPGAALVNLRRFLENGPSPGVFLATISQAPSLIEILSTVFGSSQYMADIIIRNPGYLYWLMEPHTWETVETAEIYTSEFRGEAKAFQSVEGRLNAVRRAQRKSLLKIGVRDLLGGAGVEETTKKLSDLADAIIGIVLEIVDDDLREPESGTPDPGPGGLTVVALGKLGGGELNYSSDVDLIYACGDTDEKTMDYYRKLARAHTAALSEITEEGYLYRVDLRLRPDGDVGPLVSSETSLRIYYENRGRPWEFQAMLKARVVAGDRDLGERLLNSISNLVFNPSLTYSPLEDIGRMRAQIVENIPARERAFNIKLMAGGIRDIEFSAQALQLLHGHHDRGLRSGNTLEVLDQVRRLQHLNEWEVDNLCAAYRFFRLVEHRLQMMHQIKTHTVPESPNEIALLARRVSKGPLGSYTTDDFLDALSKHLNNVRTFSDSFFAGEEVHPYSVLLMLPADDERADSIIRHHGIEDVKQAMRVLHTLAYGSFPRLYDRSTRAAFEELLPYLLEDSAETGDPGQTLIDFAKIPEASGGASSFYRLLAASKPIRKRIVAVAGFSSYLTKLLCNQMEILETVFINPLYAFTAAGAIPESERYDPKAAARNDHAAAGRRDRQRARLDRQRIGGFLLDINKRDMPRYLPGVIKGATRRLIVEAFNNSVARDDNVAVFALGSYAVGEPRLFSDMDLIVVSDDADIPEITRRVQLINRWFTDGNIVKLDFRLRGEGASAPLVQDVSFYKNYFEKRMSLWERVAFAKCAYWCGSRAVAKKFMKLLRAAVAKPFTKDDVTALVKMRGSIEKLAPRTLPGWETKRSPGGRYDVEYLTAIGMSAAVSPKDYVFSMNSRARLGLLNRAGLIDDADRAAVESALELYSKVEYLLELQEISLPRSAEKSLQLEKYVHSAIDYLGGSLTAGVAEELSRRKKSVRRCFEKVVEKAG